MTTINRFEYSDYNGTGEPYMVEQTTLLEMNNKLLIQLAILIIFCLNGCTKQLTCKVLENRIHEIGPSNILLLKGLYCSKLRSSKTEYIVRRVGVENYCVISIKGEPKILKNFSNSPLEYDAVSAIAHIRSENFSFINDTILISFHGEDYVFDIYGLIENDQYRQLDCSSHKKVPVI